MTSSPASDFKQNDQTHLKHLKLKGPQPKIIEASARAIRRVGRYFDEQIDDLSEPQSRTMRFTSFSTYMDSSLLWPNFPFTLKVQPVAHPLLPARYR